MTTFPSRLTAALFLLVAVALTASGCGHGSTAPPRAAAAVPVQVVEVVDGDTVKVLQAGREVTVRLIGMDTPETKDPRKPVQCFGPQASAQATRLMAGRSLWLTRDPSQAATDKYGRELAYAWLPDGTFYDWRMIRDGFAREYTYHAAYTYQAQFVAAQSAARAEGRGLWARTTCAGGVDSADPAGRSPPVTGH